MSGSVTLRELQQMLIDFLRHGDAAAVALVAEQPPLSAPARLSIYGNAYRVRLHQALATDHEILARYLGDDQFEEMADSYLRGHPSTVTSLRDFGEALPGFLRTESPYDQLPVLSELAAFERLMLDVFDAPDAVRAGVAELRAVPADAWPDMRIRFHPSVRILYTRSNAIPIWQSLKQSKTPPEPNVQSDAAWVLWRGSDRLSQFRPVYNAELLLLEAALHGQDFAGLCETLLPCLPESEISERILGYLIDWMAQGLVRTFSAKAVRSELLQMPTQAT